MKIYNIEDNIYCLVNPKYKKHIRYDIHDDSFFASNVEDYEESELTTDVPNKLRDTLFWALFVAYDSPRYNTASSSHVFDCLIKVLS